jgi:PAS domain S-box-containing protein
MVTARQTPASRIASRLGQRPEVGSYVAKIVLVAGAYFATAKLGLQLASANPSITAVWPPTGIALAAILIWGYRVWPGVALGAALANTFTGDAPAGAVVGITIGNTLEALAGAYLLNLAGFRPALDRIRDVLALVLAAGLSTTVSATLGVTSLWIGDQISSAGDLPSAWRVWWLGDLAGDLLVAPLLLVLASVGRPRFDARRAAEACALVVTLVALSLLVFTRDVPMAFLLFPPLIWAALRFHQLGAAFASLLVATIAVIFVNNDRGPFAHGSLDDSLMLSQAYTGIAAATALLLAAITAERARATAELRKAHDLLEETVEERTAEVEHSHRELELQALIARNMAEGVCLIRASDSAIVYANPEFERMFGPRSGELAATQIARGITEQQRPGEATYELLITKQDGTPFWCRTTTSSFDHPDHGRVWVAVHEDITERKRADLLERSFVPERLPDVPGVMLAARFIPGGAGVEIGGDWYDVLEIDDGGIGLVIGDVAGRGVQAAAVMAQLRNALRAYALEAHPPATALEHLNALACGLDETVMATAVYLVFDPASNVVRVANAGHLPPLQVGPDGSGTFLQEGRSLPLGVTRATTYREAEYPLDPGSTLLLYTDGLVERRDAAIDDGLERLAQSAAAQHDGLEQLCDSLLAALGPTGDDDVALLALHPMRLSPGQLRLTVRAEPRVLGKLRQTLGRWLEQAGVGKQESREVILACNEAVANAIEHAYGPADGSVELDARMSDGAISVRIRDHGSWREPRGTNRGRGLGLIENFMDSVEVVKRPEGGTDVLITRKLQP